MRQFLRHLATIGVLATLVAVAPRGATADEYQGRWFGGVDLGVMQPLNALDRYVQTGWSLAPFIGYKFFDDKDLQLNLGLMGELQLIGGGASACKGCVRGLGDEDTYALSYLAGPRVSLPIGPTEIYADFLGGGMTGLAGDSAITDTSGGFQTGGGINYNINDNIGLGLFANWTRQYQRVHGVGDVRFVTTGIELMVQQSPPAPPPPPAAAPPPPPPAAAPMKKKIVLRGVNFDFDKSNIRPDAVPILEQACKTLKEEPSIDVSCQGHTDSVGTEAYNQGLSERRANSVRNWLIKCGIPASRLTSKGFGEANPVASNDTAEGRAQNRRTELVVTNQ